MKRSITMAALLMVLVATVGYTGARAELWASQLLGINEAYGYLAVLGNIDTINGENVSERNSTLTLTSANGYEAILIVKTHGVERIQNVFWEFHVLDMGGYRITLIWKECLWCKQQFETIDLTFTEANKGAFEYRDWQGNNIYTGSFVARFGVQQ